MFPAYVKAGKPVDNVEEEENCNVNDGWLTNSSFQLAPPPTRDKIIDSVTENTVDLLSIPLPENDQYSSKSAHSNIPVIELSSDSCSDSSSVLSVHSHEQCSSDAESGTDSRNYNKSIEHGSYTGKIDNKDTQQTEKNDEVGRSSKKKKRKDRGSYRTRRNSRSRSRSKSAERRRARSRERHKTRTRRRNRRDSSTSSSRDKKKKKDSKERKREKEIKESSRSKERRKKRYSSESTSSKVSAGSNDKSRKQLRGSSSSSSSSVSERRRDKNISRRRYQSKSYERKNRHKKGRKREDRKKEKDNAKSNTLDNKQKTYKEPSEGYYEDRDRDVNNLLVPKLSRPMAAKRFIRHNTLGLPTGYKPSKKDVRKSRYFYVLQNPVTRSEVLGESTESKASVDLEDERSTKTAFYNRELSEDPTNIKMWIEFIDFQESMRVNRNHLNSDNLDTVHEVQKVDRATVERQLSIVEKALENNPDSDELIERRCRFAEIVLPDEKYREQLAEWANKDPSRLFLWRSLLTSTQHSLSACRTSAVNKLYSNAMEQMHALRRSRRASSEEVVIIEQKILTLLLDLGLFLRQAGLSELLWAVLSVYLELNLARLEKNKFRIALSVPENYLRELEDAVISSEMPMPTLWTRVETLRAGVHWLSLGVEEDCEDPQRMVLPEDIADLVQSINSPFLRMRLVLIALSLLKVPLLPWRDCTYKAVGLADVSWGLEGPEALLAAVFRSGTLEVRNAAAALVDCVQVASGAQFLASRPGQDQYIEFLLSVFLSCGECLPPAEQTMVSVWWLRFCRFLLQLDSWKLFSLPRGRAKKLRSAAKDLLKKEQNRTNLPLFCEFALLERELGGVESASKVLRNAISVLPSHTPVPALNDRGSVCAVYRTLVEMLISSNEREKAKGILVSLGNGGPPKEDSPSGASIDKAVSKFHHVTTELFVEVESLEENESVWKAVGVLEDAISAIPSSGRVTSCRREAIWEVYANILELHCRDTCGSYGVLRETVLKGLNEFPSNMTLLGVLSDIETSELGCGLPQWQLSRTMCNMKSPLAHALLVFLVRFRAQKREGSFGLRQMMTLLRRLTRTSNPRCPLLWRLYLQLASAVADDKTLKNVWYLTLEACPWVKVLYLDGVQAMPSELGRIQDLLQEKELRLHVTPEELDILRAD